MRPTFVLALLVSTVLAAAGADPRFEITARLVGYDLVQATGTSSQEAELPRIMVKSGSEGLIQTIREYRYEKLGTDGRARLKQTANLGIRLPIYVRQNEEGKVTFLLRAELCERADVNDPVSAVLKTTTSFLGVAVLGKTRTVTVSTPDRKQATLEITFT